jgi:hypothetical protein
MQYVITLLKIAKNREMIQLFLYEYIMGRNSKVDHTFFGVFGRSPRQPPWKII